MLESRQFNVSIACPLDRAYDFLHRPENFPRWAAGLCESIEQTAEGWVAHTPMGPKLVRFTPPNPFGVLDHHVRIDATTSVYVPMRLIANDGGCDLVFTLFHSPGMSDEQFAADIAAVQRDLAAVKTLLETLPAADTSTRS